MQIKAALPNVIKKRLFENQVTQKQIAVGGTKPNIPEEEKVEEAVEGLSHQVQAKINEKQASDAKII